MDGLISTAILIINTLPFVVSQQGFTSIDCGATEDHVDSVTKIYWTNDTAYSKTGEISILPPQNTLDVELLTARSFPTYKKNCYEINTTDNTKYLLRLQFLHPLFDPTGQDHSMYLIIDDTFIQMLNTSGGVAYFEFIITAVRNVTSICFGRAYGDPFVNSIELRELNHAMYPLATRDTILSIVHQNAVQSDINVHTLRYPDDRYDRFWLPYAFYELNETSGNQRCPENTGDEVPFAVMRDGVEANCSIEANGEIDGYGIALTSFFAEFANQGDLDMNILLEYITSNGDPGFYINSTKLSPGDCAFSTVQNGYTDQSLSSPYNLTVQSRQSRLPSCKLALSDSTSPRAILNAWHASSHHFRSQQCTNTTEFAIMKKIRKHFNINKWTGDPCLPVNFTWDKVECNYDGPNATVNSVDLSNMNLNTTVPHLFTQLTSLRTLDLSNNDLYGKLPDSLFKNHLLTVYYSNNPKLHKKGLTTTERNIVIGIVMPVGIIVLFVGFLVCRHIRGKTLEEYTKDTTETQGGESTETSKWQVPWISPIIKKDPTQT